MKDTLGLFLVVFVVVQVYKVVIHINDEPSFCDHIPEGIRHESLKVGGELVMLKNMTVGS